MFTRTTGFLIIPAWLAAMSWLVVHDVWPTLAALPAPPLAVTEWLKTDGLRSRYLILDEFGPIGTVWSEYFIDEDAVRREDLIWIDRLAAVEKMAAEFTPLRLNVSSTYTGEGELDELTIRAENRVAEMRLHGERFHADFSFVFESGPVERAFKVPLTEGRMISGALHPFGAMTNLRVGQRFRMQVVNPLASLTGFGSRFMPMVVEVTGEERITTPDGDWNCLIVESQRARAWIDANGAVIIQEIDLPILGKLRIVRQGSFDDEGRIRTRGTFLRRP